MRKSSNSKTVVALMTVTRADNSKVIVEIHIDATFSQFYHYYTQTGNKRSTKKEIRTASRNEGLPHVNAHLYAPGLEAVRAQFERNQSIGKIAAINSIKVRILRRKMYRELMSKAADLLGITKANAGLFMAKQQPAGYPIRLPAGYTPLEKRWSILTGGR